tara:strand:- start:117 stop:407 length:291 start_codon:yes stop_codon:yes gene_type:complete
MEASLLTSQDIKSMKTSFPKWDFTDTSLIRSFRFPNFIEAFGFMTKIAIIAEGMGHHPELTNSYSQLKVELTTHDLGGISNLDVELARKIDNIFND